ncbi:MAG: glutathione S-transferase N-terminal domain-containing protein [Desulfofustis sp.]|jgi:glutathione S-transferase|nr:glutathione S-transferase N-terminal domain-containing protein [Desulfofustis sp.]
MVELYIASTCPFCMKVIRAAEQMGLQEGKDYVIVDAAPGKPGRRKVVDTGGDSMVPFLIDGEVSMYESDDIIDYLRTKFVS